MELIAVDVAPGGGCGCQVTDVGGGWTLALVAAASMIARRRRAVWARR